MLIVSSFNHRLIILFDIYKEPYNKAYSLDF